MKGRPSMSPTVPPTSLITTSTSGPPRLRMCALISSVTCGAAGRDLLVARGRLAAVGGRLDGGGRGLGGAAQRGDLRGGLGVVLGEFAEQVVVGLAAVVAEPCGQRQVGGLGRRRRRLDGRR